MSNIVFGFAKPDVSKFYRVVMLVLRDPVAFFVVHAQILTHHFLNYLDEYSDQSRRRHSQGSINSPAHSPRSAASAADSSST